MMGGVSLLFSFFLVLWVHLLGLILLEKGILSFTFLPIEILSHIKGALGQVPKIFVITIGGFLIAAVGLYDDRYHIQPQTKMVWQTGIAFLIAFSGIRLSLFTDNIYISIVVTVFWLVLLMNAFNLLDNMDGLSAGVALISCLFFAFVAILTKQTFLTISMLTLAGTLAGFLIFNFYPAKIFMGDCGSQFIGYLIGTFTILETFYQPEFQTYFPILMPLFILAVPLYDTASVIVVRLKNRESIFKADCRHFSHRLQALGMSLPGTVLFIYVVAISLGLVSPILPFVSTLGAILLLIQMLCVLFIIAGLEYFGEKKLKKSKQ